MSGDRGIDVDDSALPLLRVRWPARPASADEIERFAAAMERAYRDRAIAVVVDARRAAPIGIRAMARVVAIERRMPGDALVARAIVVPSAAAVAVVTRAVSAIPHRVPTRAFEDPVEAERWARDRLR